MTMDNFRAMQLNDNANEATIEYEIDSEWASMSNHHPANDKDGAWRDIFQAHVYVDNEMARSSSEVDAPIWCSMRIDLPFAVYTRPEHYKTQEMKKGGVVYAVAWTLMEAVVIVSTSNREERLMLSVT
ncbi:hypothetical protein SARC_01736 [Sphaeroforma arctica JP610]|uniref:Uncharacterized protein n=1 Tax=Sphaeroforma arctica JP610 TaxID=667725 RepID=A0A0L0GAW3_9EUKA|nr:hypothetical protein SARC_01736 [Sphaeroforma arctica JP610]KNC86120.1 hypothetical protein SARC_01736 [Sphaeroforma arctica JP610]|eukprot:XP_014160022.1 hypothetical protein SARC_01736 [Sphaeroforma arctica JP610]